MNTNIFLPATSGKTYKKLTDHTVNNLAVVHDDDELANISLKANTIFKVDICLIFTSAAAADFKCQMKLDQNATFIGLVLRNPSGGGSSSTVGMNVQSQWTSEPAGDGLAAAVTMMCITGFLKIVTAANMKIQFAQNAADVSDTVLKAGSSVTITELK